LGPEGIYENHDNQFQLYCKNAWLHGPCALKFMSYRGPCESLAPGSMES